MIYKLIIDWLDHLILISGALTLSVDSSWTVSSNKTTCDSGYHPASSTPSSPPLQHRRKHAHT